MPNLRFDRVDTGGLEAGLENGVLVVRGADAAGGAVLQVAGHLRNGLYPQRIAAATLALDWREAQPGSAVARATIVPDAITDLAPQARSAPLTVTLTLPPLPRPDGIAGLLTGSRPVDGTLTPRLTQLRLALDPEFLERVRPIFGSGLLAADQPTGPVTGDPDALEDRLPGLFRGYREIAEAEVSLPVRIEAAFPAWPLAGALALTGAAGFGAASIRRARLCTVKLGPYTKRASLRLYRPEVLRAPDGSRWRVRAGLWGEPRATRIDQTGPGA